MGKPKAQPTNQPASQPAETLNQPANPEPQTGTNADASLQDNKGAVNASTASNESIPNDAENAPEIKEEGVTDEASQEAKPSFIEMLIEALSEAEDPDEIAALQQLIALAEAHPEDEREFIKLLVVEMGKQFRAYDETIDGPVVFTTPSVEELDALKELDAEEDPRAKRLRENAQAELDGLKEESRKRQEAAEAQQAEAQPDRREALKES